MPYTIAGLRKLVEKRVDSSDNRGRGDVNRLYPSKEAYLKTVYDVIFGYVEPGRMMTMEKSAIALRMTNGTGQFLSLIHISIRTSINAKSEHAVTESGICGLRLYGVCIWG